MCGKEHVLNACSGSYQSTFMDRSSVLKGGVILLLLGGLATWRIMDERPVEPPQPEPQAETQATGQPDAPGNAASPTASAAPKDSTEAYNSSGKLQYTDLKAGTGAVAKAGQPVTVHYRGTLTDGKQFDASYDRGEPFTFNLGAGEVIQGWDKGVAGMKVGGKRKLVIPPDMGYGPNGSPPTIPPNATLLFEVELLKVG
ncbi:MAG: peptidylprolyl isomerase [Abditibacteriota bacterium]|nr:peptidylprolyl isomerase [Abditibacteriota bacterium]